MGDQTADKRRKKATDCRFCLRPFLKNIRTRKIIIKWKKDSKVSGYQLQYAKNKNFYTTVELQISVKKRPLPPFATQANTTVPGQRSNPVRW